MPTIALCRAAGIDAIASPFRLSDHSQTGSPFRPALASATPVKPEHPSRSA